MIKAFYNTIGLAGDDLKQAVINAENQDAAIYLIYENTGKPYSPSQILRLMEKAGKTLPLTSCRRSITNLTKSGKLVKTNLMVEGLYKLPEHTWIIKKTI